MRFELSDEQEGLRRSVRRVLDAGGDPWTQLGLGGLLDAGCGWVEVAAVQEELGRALATSPFFATVGLAGAALRCAGRVDLLGERTATLVVDPRHVVDGDTAELLIVAGDDAVYAIEAARVTRRRLATLDDTRPLAEVEVGAAPGERIGDRAILDRALALASIALAAEQVGVAARCLELSVEYAKVRHQFGRPIGSFQAIQHACADMFVLVESARSAAWYAAWAADQDDPDLPTIAAVAAATCGEAAFRVAGEAIQVHGGIGFTWEHPAHRYFKRARAARALLGTPDHHREQVARRIIDDGSPLL